MGTNFANSSLSRRHLLQIGGAVAGSTALNGLMRHAWAQPEITNISITQAVSSLAFIQNAVAQEAGFFGDEGLDVEIVVTRGGGPDVQAVLAGDAAFTVNDGAQVLPALAKGQELTNVLATLNRNIINVSMFRETAERLGITPESSIEKKLASLKGLRIGITRPGALTWQLARFNLATAGLDPDEDAEIVGLGGGAAVAAGLENGAVDVIYISVPLGERVVASGKAITLIDNARGEDPNLPVFLMEGLWARPDFLEENPNTALAAVRALKRASDLVRSNTAKETAELIRPQFSGFDESLLVEGVDKVKAAVAADGRINQRILDFTQEVLTLNDVIDRRFTVDEVFDDRFIAQAG